MGFNSGFKGLIKIKSADPSFCQTESLAMATTLMVKLGA